MSLLGRWMVIAALCGCATGNRNQPAASAASPQDEAVASAPDSKDRLICRKEQVIGSNRRQRVCRRQSDTDRQREATRTQMGKGSGGPSMAEQPGL